VKNLFINKWAVLIKYPLEYSSKDVEQLKNNITDALLSNGFHKYSIIDMECGCMQICCFHSEDSALSLSKIVSRVMGVSSVIPAIVIGFNGFNDLIDNIVEVLLHRARGMLIDVELRYIDSQNLMIKDLSELIDKTLLEVKKLKHDSARHVYRVYIEVSRREVYIYDKIFEGSKGLPIGSGDVALALFSGGIDSPVATWFLLRKGFKVHMVLFNLGGDRHVYGALKVAKVLADRWVFGYRPKLYVVDLRPLIMRIALYSKEDHMVILMRRTMFRIANRLAEKIGAKVLATGESIGQVASQTLHNLFVINKASVIPVLRPLIGLDKEEIIRYARFIGTYEYSIKVGEFCPIGASKTTTKANIKYIEDVENKIINDDFIENLISNAVEYDLKSVDSDLIDRKFTEILHQQSCNI
jgi:thiamine biosynthesis protein ThiI